MKNSVRSSAGVSSAFTAIVSLTAFGITTAWAQQKQLVKFEAPAANTNYTQQHSIAVGDVAGHDVRVFENVRTFRTDHPLIIGDVRVKEWWVRGYTDFTEASGPGTVYHTLMMENGDKIFMRANFVAQSIAAADGAKKGANSFVAGPITGGTGKFLGIRGMMKLTAVFDPKSGFNDSKGEIEYWIDK